jgi:putative hemolysin
MFRSIASLIVLLSAAGAAAQAPSAPQLANPASVNCARQGGTLSIERRPDGGAFGVCIFTDNYQCEEWALLRGECPKSGLRVTGYATQAGRYCAITGGRYEIVSAPGMSPERGTCSVVDGRTCDADAWYAGSCAGR